jgi:hypothetical protein
LVYFMVIWYMFPVFGIFYHEKSGNPGWRRFFMKSFLGWKNFHFDWNLIYVVYLYFRALELIEIRRKFSCNSIRVTRGRCYDHNFRRFFQIVGEKIGVFLKYQCYDQLFSKCSFVLSQKRQFFRKNFRRKYLKNHNIGPRLGEFSHNELLFSLGSFYYRSGPIVLWATFFLRKKLCIHLAKRGWATFWAGFPQNYLVTLLNST